MAVPPRVLSSSSVSTLRIRFLALVVFSVLSCTFSEHCRKKSVDQRPPKSKAEFRMPIVDFLCVKVLRRVKKDRTLVKKLRSSLSQRAAEHPMQWVKKQRTGLLNRHPFERKSSSIRAKGRQSRSTGFARDFGSIVAGTRPIGRTLDLYILADPWRYAAISIECVACNCGDLFNDRGISKKPEKHA